MYNKNIKYYKYRPVLSSLNVLHTRDRRARAVFGPVVFFYLTYRDMRRGETV